MPRTGARAIVPAGTAAQMWLGALLALLVLLLVQAPVQAHADLQSSDPADGAALASAPAAMTFTFNEDVLDQGNAITLTDVASGSRLEVGPPEVDGRSVSVAWPPASPAGEFRAAYRVVSADGHPIEGSITFTVEQPAGQVQASPIAAPADDAPSASPAASAVPAEAASAAQSPAPTSDSDSGSGSVGPLVWFLALGIAIVVGAGAGMWVMRKTR
jgi:methionine-rich copper-binding protein CopC